LKQSQGERGGVHGKVGFHEDDDLISVPRRVNNPGARKHKPKVGAKNRRGEKRGEPKGPEGPVRKEEKSTV